MNTAETALALAPADADSAADFRQAMRRLASAVAVVAAVHEDEWIGMTATSVTSLSMEPPSLLICVNRSATIHKALSPGSAFSVNMLERSHEDVSAAFGGNAKGSDRFRLGSWRRSEAGLPVMDDAIAAIECSVDGAFDYGTHTIVIGKVRQTRLSSEQTPLIYVNGQYQ